MAEFPDISPILNRSMRNIRESLKEVLGYLPESFYQDYWTYVQNVKDRPENLTTGIHWCLFHYFLYSGFLQMRISLNGVEVLTHGAEILNEQKIELTDSSIPILCGEENLTLSYIYRKLESDENSDVLEFEGIVPSQILNLVRAVVDLEILPLAKNYYFYDPVFCHPWIHDYFVLIERECNSVIAKEVSRKKQVTVSHFLMQDPSQYFEVLGEHRSGEIIKDIKNTIGNHAKKTDLLLSLNPRSFLLLSPGMESGQVRQRFENVFFQINSLVLDYEVYSHTIREFPVNLLEIFEKIKVRI